MIDTDMTRKALEIAESAHEGQYDKGGKKYLEHPVFIAEQMNNEDTCIAALLHDVAEDTYVTLEDLLKLGFSIKVIIALSFLTHEKNTPYMEYVRKIAYNPIASKVKLADLLHNSDLTRLNYISDKDIERKNKYLQAIEYLKSIDWSSVKPLPDKYGVNYYITEHSAIIKKDSLTFFELGWDGKWFMTQSHADLWYGKLMDFIEIPEEIVEEYTCKLRYFNSLKKHC